AGTGRALGPQRDQLRVFGGHGLHRRPRKRHLRVSDAEELHLLWREVIPARVWALDDESDVDVSANEEGIDPVSIARHEPVPEPLGEAGESVKTRAVEARPVPAVRGVIAHDPTDARWKRAVVFDDNDARPITGGQLLPQPIVVAV